MKVCGVELQGNEAIICILSLSDSLFEVSPCRVQRSRHGLRQHVTAEEDESGEGAKQAEHRARGPRGSPPSPTSP